MNSLQGVLSNAMHDVFIIATFIALTALVLVLFLPENKLKKAEKPEKSDAGLEAPAESVPAPVH